MNENNIIYSNHQLNDMEYNGDYLFSKKNNKQLFQVYLVLFRQKKELY